MKSVLNAKVFLASVLFVSLTGCSSYNNSQPTEPFVGKVESSVKADVTVGEKISGESKANIAMGFIKWGEGNHYVDGVNYGTGDVLSFADQTASVKAAAAYNAVKNSGADLIVAPRYEVTVHNYVLFKTIDVVVTGYKGTIASVK
ncbi:hypothetical protein [Citrobacter werkmanii]|uniref:hypothetical protein n=1 Tax=Citrobacter werkmanii TaxID=67827 RepID=UPI00264DC147|nr:hypothetical protein [Citrobacter werkmanii]MDN8558378.1 hypothetical protein [Citrobacter werkmanii]